MGAIMQASLYSQAKKEMALPSGEFASPLAGLLAPSPWEDGLAVTVPNSRAPSPSRLSMDGELVPSPHDGLRSLDVGSASDSEMKPAWTNDTIRNAASRLKSLYQSAHRSQAEQGIKHSSVSLTTEVYSEVQKWLVSPSSQALTLEGPSEGSHQSHSTLTSSFIISNLNKLDIPVIAWKLVYDYRKGFDSMTELQTLVYSLVYQVSLLLPQDINSFMYPTLDLSPARFSCIDGDVENLTDAILVLDTMLKVSPPLLFCVLDRLQHLDRNSTASGYAVQCCVA